MSPARLERLRFAALMHDVGKLVVPNHLLNKKGKLTAEEFAQVRMHEEVSVEILTRIDFLAPVAPSATSEAAEFAPVADDRGQPIEPHIVAVADAFDAMTSTRSYRKALPQETAFDELRKNSGKQFHPRVVDALIVAIEQRGEEHGPVTKRSCTTPTRPRPAPARPGSATCCRADGPMPDWADRSRRRADDARAPASRSSSLLGAIAAGDRRAGRSRRVRRPRSPCSARRSSAGRAPRPAAGRAGRRCRSPTRSSSCWCGPARPAEFLVTVFAAEAVAYLLRPEQSVWDRVWLTAIRLGAAVAALGALPRRRRR